jgi:hypothetical protein
MCWLYSTRFYIFNIHVLFFIVCLTVVKRIYPTALPLTGCVTGAWYFAGKVNAAEDGSVLAVVKAGALKRVA